MNFYQKITLLLLSFLLFSCSTFENVPGRKKVKFDTYGYKVLNGKYELYYGEDTKPSLNKRFYLSTIIDEIEENRNDNYVEIEVVNERRIEARLYIDNEMVEKRRLKGKFKDNYFVLKKRRVFKLNYLLLNTSATEKNRLFLTPEGDLVVDSVRGGCGLLVFFPVFCAGNERYNQVYSLIGSDTDM